jgi:hypothetical protein
MPDLGFTELFTRQDADYGSRTFTAADPWLVSWSFGTYPRQPTARVGPRRPGETISSNKPRQLSGNVRLQRRAEHRNPRSGRHRRRDSHAKRRAISAGVCAVIKPFTWTVSRPSRLQAVRRGRMFMQHRIAARTSASAAFRFIWRVWSGVAVRGQRAGVVACWLKVRVGSAKRRAWGQAAAGWAGRAILAR